MASPDGATKGRRAKVHDTTPRSFLGRVSSSLLDKFKSGNFDEFESENYRFASLLVDAVRDGRAAPYEFVVRTHYAGLAPRRKQEPVRFNITPEQYFSRKDAAAVHGPVVPSSVNGRDSREWVASVIAYLGYRIQSEAGADRFKRLYHPASDALRIIHAVNNGIPVPAKYARRLDADAPAAIKFSAPVRKEAKTPTKEIQFA